ncbi:unnamed protein product [Adineta ricciae]|uniref:ABC transmembrane type-1 domain-containing protein n=1 Tax=Adineta ricciae TaxID=249248 RepID=A0A814IFA7_ADIRI|nr:unnamed protein product [Adineta ricciae]CAF1024998.1 unnamed protein product [Adineta ricciae]
MSGRNSFNYLFAKRIAHLLHIFLPLSRLSLNSYKEGIYAHPLVLIFLLLANEIGLQFVIYFVGLLPSQFYVELIKAPDQRNFSLFRWLVIRAFGLVILNAFFKSLSTFLSSVLYVKWRMRLVLYLHSIYFTKQRYYHLLNTTQQNHNRSDHDQASVYENQTVQTTDIDDNDDESVDGISPTTPRLLSTTKPLIDNPDQRITQDADALCRSLSVILPIVLISPFTIVYYTYRTWEVTGYYGPLVIVLYFVIWTAINKIFLSAVSRTIFSQNIFEGTFRFLHTQVRTYNESIAFYNGGAFEHKRFDNYFLQSLTPILYRRNFQELSLNLSMNLFDYIGSILSYLLLALVIFVFHFYDNLSPAALVDKISKTSFMIMYLIYRFSQLNDLTDRVTVIAANTHRVQTFVEFMKNIDTTWAEKSINPINQQNEILSIKNLSYSIPNKPKHVLMKNLNLILYQGQRLLITGDSGVGKTSLFRILHSIWPVNIHGDFSYNPSRAFLLPQRPYFTNQSIHDELEYPNVENVPLIARQTEIEQLLHDWNLSHILDSVECSVFVCPKYPWQDILSPGELQRLSFLRLILRLSADSSNLSLIFLDEITSSLDAQMETKMYNYLIEKNLTLISIGHRDSLRQYHQIKLILFKNGRYVLENLPLIN